MTENSDNKWPWRFGNQARQIPNDAPEFECAPTQKFNLAPETPISVTVEIDCATGQGIPGSAEVSVPSPDNEGWWRFQSRGDQYVDESRRTEMLDFAAITQRTCPPMIQRLIHASLGMASEAGEFAGAIKAFIFYNRELDQTNLVEELGDVMWFLAQACHALGVTFEDVQKANLAKLRKRFPARFTEEHANNRDLDGERQALEGGQ